MHILGTTHALSLRQSHSPTLAERWRTSKC